MADTDKEEIEEGDEEMNELNSKRQMRKTAELAQIIAKDEHRLRFKKVTAALKKDPNNRTPAEVELLKYSDDLIQEIQKRANHREKQKSRQQEVEDDAEMLDWKCKQLSAAIKQAKNLVVYTGAGISTSASIPDYRGPNGVWTLLQQGKQLSAQDLSDAEPTLTHMALARLHDVKLIKHVVSQNCDGLHLRSGLPKTSLSEVHGNMFVERCPECKPIKEYIRLFDVTEKTGVRRHKTDRKCPKCKSHLKDTIIHFGEKAPLNGIYNWERASRMVKKADMILCLGSSLKVLRKYACLWSMHLPVNQRPKLYIVNLQWTPKDDLAILKINGKCDEVMGKVMENLGFNLPAYRRECDPIFWLCSKLRVRELKSTTRKILAIPDNLQYPPPKQRTSKKSVAQSRKRKLKSQPLRGNKMLKLESDVEVDISLKKEEDKNLSEEDDFQTMKWMLNQPVNAPPLHNQTNIPVSTVTKHPVSTVTLADVTKSETAENLESHDKTDLKDNNSLSEHIKTARIKLEHNYSTRVAPPVAVTAPICQKTQLKTDAEKSTSNAQSAVLSNLVSQEKVSSTVTKDVKSKTDPSIPLHVDVNLPPIVPIAPFQPVNLQPVASGQVKPIMNQPTLGQQQALGQQALPLQALGQQAVPQPQQALKYAVPLQPLGQQAVPQHALGHPALESFVPSQVLAQQPLASFQQPQTFGIPGQCLLPMPLQFQQQQTFGLPYQPQQTMFNPFIQPQQLTTFNQPNLYPFVNTQTLPQQAGLFPTIPQQNILLSPSNGIIPTVFPQQSQLFGACNSVLGGGVPGLMNPAPQPATPVFQQVIINNPCINVFPQQALGQHLNPGVLANQAIPRNPGVLANQAIPQNPSFILNPQIQGAQIGLNQNILANNTGQVLNKTKKITQNLASTYQQVLALQSKTSQAIIEPLKPLGDLVPKVSRSMGHSPSKDTQPGISRQPITTSVPISINDSSNTPSGSIQSSAVLNVNSKEASMSSLPSNAHLKSAETAQQLLSSVSNHSNDLEADVCDKTVSSHKTKTSTISSSSADAKVSVVTSSATVTIATERDKTADKKQVTVTITDTPVTTSIPGWFGKGFNPRRIRKKKSKS